MNSRQNAARPLTSNTHRGLSENSFASSAPARSNPASTMIAAPPHSTLRAFMAHRAPIHDVDTAACHPSHRPAPRASGTGRRSDVLEGLSAQGFAVVVVVFAVVAVLGLVVAVAGLVVAVAAVVTVLGLVVAVLGLVVAVLGLVVAVAAVVTVLGLVVAVAGFVVVTVVTFVSDPHAP